MSQQGIAKSDNLGELIHISLGVCIGKWLLDKSVALVGCVIAVLLYPLIGLAIKLESPGPIIFKQLRVGRSDRNYTQLFTIYKFRTMRIDAESDNKAVWATKNDQRATKLGRWLRKTRLDEIPQFFNIIKGDMSLIGPRPERPAFIAKLECAIPFYTERMYGVTPGVTGLAQVRLGYDENIEHVREKVAYDHAYALALSSFRHWLVLDVWILLQTMKVVILRQGL